MLYLSRGDVQRVNLPMTVILDAVEGVFREKGLGQVEMPPKIGVHPTNAAFLHAMPGLVPSAGAVGMKWVSNFGENPSRGLSTISGLLVLNDPETGFPIAVMDCTWITAQRTGAASAVAAKYLAKQDAECLTIIGCGVQGRSHLEAMLAAFPGLEAGYRLRPTDGCARTVHCRGADDTPCPGLPGIYVRDGGPRCGHHRFRDRDPQGADTRHSCRVDQTRSLLHAHRF